MEDIIIQSGHVGIYDGDVKQVNHLIFPLIYLEINHKILNISDNIRAGNCFSYIASYHLG